jgi:acyl carrier protein
LTHASIADMLEQFIRRQFVVAEADRRFTRAAALFELGYIDSVGVVELLAFVGREWSVEIPGEDLVSEEFTSIDSIAGVIHRLSCANSRAQQA